MSAAVLIVLIVLLGEVLRHERPFEEGRAFSYQLSVLLPLVTVCCVKYNSSNCSSITAVKVHTLMYTYGRHLHPSSMQSETKQGTSVFCHTNTGIPTAVLVQRHLSSDWVLLSLSQQHVHHKLTTSSGLRIPNCSFWTRHSRADEKLNWEGMLAPWKQARYPDEGCTGV